MVNGNAMSYNNNYQNRGYNRGGGYGSGSYRNRGYQSGGNRQSKKHSGCQLKTMEDGAPVISGWNYSRRGGMVHLYARPYKGTKKSTSKSGKSWMNLFVTITNTSTKVQSNYSGLFDVDSKKMYIKDLNMIANPKAPHGGYFGKHISKN